MKKTEEIPLSIVFKAIGLFLVILGTLIFAISTLTEDPTLENKIEESEGAPKELPLEDANQQN